MLCDRYARRRAQDDVPLGKSDNGTAWRRAGPMMPRGSNGERRPADVVGRAIHVDGIAAGGMADTRRRMQTIWTIELPPPRWKSTRPGPSVFGPETEPPLFPAETRLDDLQPLQIRTVVRGTRDGVLWNRFIARCHDLGHIRLVRARMCYAIHDRASWPIAMPGFSTAAWTLAPRDSVIGWMPELRRKNLSLVADNPGLLIMPWLVVSKPGLHILAHPSAPATGPDRAICHSAGAHRDLRRSAALHRRRLPRVRLDPCRNHSGARPIRPEREIRQAEK